MFYTCYFLSGCQWFLRCEQQKSFCRCMWCFSSLARCWRVKPKKCRKRNNHNNNSFIISIIRKMHKYSNIFFVKNSAFLPLLSSSSTVYDRGDLVFCWCDCSAKIWWKSARFSLATRVKCAWWARHSAAPVSLTGERLGAQAPTETSTFFTQNLRTGVLAPRANSVQINRNCACRPGTKTGKDRGS